MKQYSSLRSIPGELATGRVPCRRLVMMLGIGGLLVTGPLAGRAQQIEADPVRVTVPAYAGGQVTNIVLELDAIGTNETLHLWVDISGATGIISATLNEDTFTESTGTNVLNTNAVLTVTYDATVPQTGVNEIAILSSNAYETRLPLPIKSAVFWNGNTNNTAYEAATNWLEGAVPAEGDVALFGTTLIGTNVAAPGDSGTNVIISADTPALGGLRFAHVNFPQVDDTYDVLIQTNVTLRVTGPEGFTLLADSLYDEESVNLFGGGNLVVSNSAADIGMYSVNESLNMSGLATFVADVNRICLENFSCYPNFDTNGHGGPGTVATDVYLARTNFIKTAWIGGEAVITNNGDTTPYRPYAFSFSVNEDQGVSASSTSILEFGASNVFFVESILFGGAGVNSYAGDIAFSTDTNVVPTNVVPVLYLRGEQETNRVAVMAIGDISGPGVLSNHSDPSMDLRNGRVDARVDVLYVARDRWACGDNDGVSSTFWLGGENAAGTLFDVNTVYLGMQEQGTNHATAEQLEDEDDPRGESQGRLNVGANAVFTVHDTLHLGYTTAAPGDLRRAEDGFGRLNVSGGTARVNHIEVGGVTRVSIDNRVSLSAGGELIVTNAIGSTNKGLAILTMSDSTLTLHVDGNRTDPYVFTEDLVTGGTGNTLRLASVVNVGSFPATIPLISYDFASPNFGVELPEGFYGYIVNNDVNNTIDVVILNTPPQQLVWNSGTWDTGSSSWKEGKIFANGDSPTFDDTATSSSVSVPGTVFVGGSGVLVTNTTKAYTFSGGGLIGGTAPMNKWGPNSLTMGMDSALPLILNQGTVTVNAGASVGSTTVRSNTTLTASGSLNRLTSEGTVTLLNGSSVVNGATLQGGTVSDSGTINGEVTVEAEATLTVNADGVVNNSAPHVSDIEADGSVVLNGVWENGHPLDADGQYRINVFGTLTGVGSVEGVSWQDQAIPDLQSRLNIGAGGVFSPGSAPGHIITFTNLGRFDFVTGARVILDVDMDSADGSSPWSAFTPNAGNNTGAVIQQKAKTSDTIWTDRWSTMTGTLVLNNVGSTPFTNGAVFKFFKKELDAFAEYPGNFGNRPDNAGQLPVIEPALPGLGLQWDLSLFRTNGLVSVVAGGPTTPPAVDFVLTNDLMVLYWPSNYVGWQVYAQTNELEVGLSTNWFPVPGTTAGTNYTVEIVSSNPAVFYQLGLPAVTAP